MRWVNAVSLLAVPFLLSFFPLYAALRRIAVYEEFVDGAKEGFNVAVRIIPYLVAMLVAIGMFRGAGGIDLLTRWLKPALDLVHPEHFIEIVVQPIKEQILEIANRGVTHGKQNEFASALARFRYVRRRIGHAISHGRRW